MNEMIERVEFAISRVNICFSSGERTGNQPKWVVWDRNLDDEDGHAWVYIGAPANLATDTLEKPPGDVFWAHQHARARAAIKAMREPTEAMLDKGPGDPYMDRGVWAKMIDAALKETP